MPRPRKWRRVCCLPESCRFGPLDNHKNEDDIIIMSVDEYETIRLIDLDGFTQEQCAEQMDISRTTVQGIYDSARKKLAQSLVSGIILIIEGGEYRLCDGNGRGCGGAGCRRHRCGRFFQNTDDKEDSSEDSNTNE
jgi:Predicted DNA-binding proteins